MSITFVILEPGDEQNIETARTILGEYFKMRDYDPAAGDYETEMATLPGPFARPGGVFYIAFHEGEPAGTIAFKRMEDPAYCEMKRLYVRPGFRGKRIGYGLVGKLIETAREDGYRFMRLDNHVYMTDAESIYEAYGFKRIEPYWDNPVKGSNYFELDLRG